MITQPMMKISPVCCHFNKVNTKVVINKIEPAISILSKNLFIISMVSVQCQFHIFLQCRIQIRFFIQTKMMDIGSVAYFSS